MIGRGRVAATVRAIAMAAGVGGVLPPVQAAGPALEGEFAAGLWSSDRRLEDRSGIASARARLALDWQVGEGVSVRGEAWAAWGPERLDGRSWDAGLRRLLVAFDSVPCTPALGREEILWGRSDGLNPTDQVSPRNFLRLSPRDRDQRSGRGGLHLDCMLGEGRFQAHWLSEFHFHDVPLPLPPGIRFREDDADAGADIAMRYERRGQRLDWALSVLDGHDPYPTLAVRDVMPGGLLLGRDASPIRMLGGDAALAIGTAVLRAEVARTWQDGNGRAGSARRPSHTAVVAGAEWFVGDMATFSVQGFWKHLDGRGGTATVPARIQQAQGLLANEVDRNQHGLTLRYARPLWESRGDVEVFAVWSRPRDDWMLRARLERSLGDRSVLRIGADLFGGPADSYLGNLRDNRLAVAELGYAW